MMLFTVPLCSLTTLVHNPEDKDGSVYATHHTLGSNANQASPGDHTHDGGTSVKPLSGMTATDLADVIVCLEALGANG